MGHRSETPARRLVAILAGGALVTAGLAAAPVAGAPPAGAAPSAIPVVSAQSGRCLDVSENNPHAGALVITYDCHGADNQEFVLADDGEIRPGNSTLCVDVATHPATDGDQLRTATCDADSRDQKFGLRTDGTIVNVVTGLCVGIPTGIVANGTRPALAACDGSDGQLWSGGVSRGLQTVTDGEAASVHGVNWADPDDNFKTTDIVPSGLVVTDDYATTYAKAVPIIRGFRSAGANTIRLGINESTVDGSWWSSFRAVVDAAEDDGLDVVLGYWTRTSGHQLSPTELAPFYEMWNTVMADYGGDPHVYADIMNEPSGYTVSEWRDLAAQWLSTYSYFPRSQVVVAGSGYDDTPANMCVDPRFDGTLLSYHQYTYTERHGEVSTWAGVIAERVGACADRTVVTEFGDWASSGIDFDGPQDGGDTHVAYMAAMTSTIRALGMGALYWPGYRVDDAFSLLSLEGSGATATLSVVNQTLLDRLQYAWGLSDDQGGNGAVTHTTSYTLGAAATCLVVTGQAAVLGAPMKVKTCSGSLTTGATDITIKASGQLGLQSLCLAPSALPATEGTPVVLATCATDGSQAWRYDVTTKAMTDLASGLCLQGAGGSTASDTAVVLGTCAGTDAQRWSRRY